MEPGKTLRKLAPAISLVLFVAAIAVVYREARTYHWQTIRNALRAVPTELLIVCAALTLAGYLTLSLYDRLALKYAGEKLPYRRVLFTSFVSYAISNTAGHAWLTGGSMRYRLYSGWGLPGLAIVKVTLFCTASSLLGYLTLMVGGYILTPGHAAISGSLPSGLMETIVAFACLVLVAWWSVVVARPRPLEIRGFRIPVPGVSLALSQLGVALLDTALVSLVMYVPLSHFAPAPYSEFVVLYVLAQIAGLASLVPGGVGVFEGVFMFLASPHYAAPDVLAALVIYRVTYYVAPLMLAGVILAGYELGVQRMAASGRRAVAALNVIESAVPPIFALLLVLGGAMLLVSGATPALPERLKWLAYLVPLPAMELSHLLGSVVGIILLLLSQAVRQRLDTAYFATIAVLGLGIVVSLGKGLDYEEALILALMLAVFLPARKSFYRKSALLQLQLPGQWGLLAATVVLGSIGLGFFSYKHVEYSNELWWQFALYGDASRFLRSLVAILVVVTAFAAYRLLTRPALALALPEPRELDRAAAIARRSGDTNAYLALTGDKYLLWGKSGNSFLMFTVAGQFWVAMGDPAGAPEEHEELVWELRTLADRYNTKAAFYQVGADHLPLYLDLGLALVKLGEEARVPLGSFRLSGNRHAGLRHAYNRLAGEGLSFEVVPASSVEALLPELRAVSDRWLQGKQTREKRFSLGFFSPDYLQRCDMAVARQQGRIVAFANLWAPENKTELSMDLMRYEPDAVHGLMDYLIVSLLLWGKEQGYEWFNLGMAPLSGLEQRPLAPLWNRIGNAIFRFGSEFYNFEGLYQYKRKFDPVWRPRYLAAPAGLSMAAALVSVTAAISGDAKGVLGK